MRAFTAIDIPKEIKARINDASKQLRSIDGARLVDEDSMHITLHFLGEISDAQADHLKEAMASIDFAPFEISIKGIGFFEPERPRVVFAGLEKGAEEVKRLYALLYDPIIKLGIRLEEREYIPHLTIARLKFAGTHSARLLERFAEEHKEEFGSFECKSVALKRSDFTSGGVKHTTLYEKRF
jgi:2'-5' RNA ligase